MPRHRAIVRAAVPLLLCGAAVRAQPLSDRPLVLPRGAFDVTVLGTYSNWGPGAQTPEGEAVAVAADFGIGDATQVGFAVAFPVAPGAGFGSVLASIAGGSNPAVAFRLDAGYERIGDNGPDIGETQLAHINRYFGGAGFALNLPVSREAAIVMGRTGAARFGHFANVAEPFGPGGVGFYQGASALSDTSSDFVVVSTGDHSTATLLGLNIPLGLRVQPVPAFAVTLQAGYSALVAFPSVGNSQTFHFVPLGIEAVLSPVKFLDVGARFTIDGWVGGPGPLPGYGDYRELSFWITLRGLR